MGKAGPPDRGTPRTPLASSASVGPLGNADWCLPVTGPLRGLSELLCVTCAEQSTDHRKINHHCHQEGSAGDGGHTEGAERVGAGACTVQGGLASGSGQDEKLGQESDCTKVHKEARVASSGKGFPMAGSIQPVWGFAEGTPTPSTLEERPEYRKRSENMAPSCHHHRCFRRPVQARLSHSRSAHPPSCCKGSLRIAGTRISCPSPGAWAPKGQ